MYFPPIPLIRKRLIIRKLTACKAFSIETAKTLKEAGITNPNGFKNVTKKLIKEKIITKTHDDKYYLNAKYI